MTYRCSASQVSVAELCLRKWGFSKLDGIEAPQNRYAAFGSQTHAHCEAWFRHRTPPPETPEGLTARLIVRELPPPQTEGIEIEKAITLELGGIPFRGFVDFRILNRRFVSDHKTCGSFNYALSPETMKDDVQATIYAYDAMNLTNTFEVDLQWTYGQRNGKKVLPVRATVTLDEIRPRLERTAATAQLLRDVTEEHPKAIELPFDAEGCEAFGGCPFRELCNLSPQQRIRSIMAQNKKQDDWRKRFEERKAARAATPHPPPEEENTANINPPDAPPEPEPEPSPAPAAAPSQPKRRGRPPKSAEQKAEDQAEKARVAAAVEARKTAAVRTPLHEEVAAAVEQPVGVVEVLIAKYREGFLDGFKLGRSER